MTCRMLADVPKRMLYASNRRPVPPFFSDLSSGSPVCALLFLTRRPLFHVCVKRTSLFLRPFLWLARLRTPFPGSSVCDSLVCIKRSLSGPSSCSDSPSFFGPSSGSPVRSSMSARSASLSWPFPCLFILARTPFQAFREQFRVSDFVLVVARYDIKIPPIGSRLPLYLSRKHTNLCQSSVGLCTFSYFAGRFFLWLIRITYLCLT